MVFLVVSIFQGNIYGSNYFLLFLFLTYILHFTTLFNQKKKIGTVGRQFFEPPQLVQNR